MVVLVQANHSRPIGTCSSTPKGLAILTSLLVGMALRPGTVLALEPGPTPSHVYSLWANIYDCLLISASTVSDDLFRRQQLTATTPKTFDGKEPKDVLGHVRVYLNDLDKLRQQAGFTAARRLNEPGDTVTPSDVYLNSGQALIALREWLIRGTDAKQPVTEGYDRRELGGKTPGDVFGLIHLANRRLVQILAESGVCEQPAPYWASNRNCPNAG